MSPAEETYFDMAKSFEEKGNYEKALVWYRKIQNNGDVYEIIGEYLYFGRGCGKDVCEAKKYFEKAAELGNIDALCNLALCEEDLDKKLYLYKMASDKGCSYAMNMMGIVSEETNLSDSSLICKWFKQAADTGSELGCYNYAMNCDDDHERMKYLELAVNKEYIVAMETYIYYLENGLYCNKDVAKAEEIRNKIKMLQGKVSESV